MAASSKHMGQRKGSEKDAWSCFLDDLLERVTRLERSDVGHEGLGAEKAPAAIEIEVALSIYFSVSRSLFQSI
jgi:hypothetical protein